MVLKIKNQNWIWKPQLETEIKNENEPKLIFWKLLLKIAIGNQRCRFKGKGRQVFKSINENKCRFSPEALKKLWF